MQHIIANDHYAMSSVGRTVQVYGVSGEKQTIQGLSDRSAALFLNSHTVCAGDVYQVDAQAGKVVQVWHLPDNCMFGATSGEVAYCDNNYAVILDTKTKNGVKYKILISPNALAYTIGHDLVVVLVDSLMGMSCQSLEIIEITRGVRGVMWDLANVKDIGKVLSMSSPQVFYGNNLMVAVTYEKVVRLLRLDVNGNGLYYVARDIRCRLWDCPAYKLTGDTVMVISKCKDPRPKDFQSQIIQICSKASGAGNPVVVWKLDVLFVRKENSNMNEILPDRYETSWQVCGTVMTDDDARVDDEFTVQRRDGQIVCMQLVKNGDGDSDGDE